jgi:uncharacterized YigZ family protein
MENEIKDTYKTITAPAVGEIFKDRASKFIGYAYPVTSEDEVKEYIQALKKEHHTARHWCYAWQMGTSTLKTRANDDGEPSNSAGNPILGQLVSFDVTNTLVVVVRYFGGTKLGVGGLINAYRTGAKYALEEATIVTRTIDKTFTLIFEYADMNKVMRIIKENKLHVLSQEMEMQCVFKLSIRLKDVSRIQQIIEDLRKVKLKVED